MKRFTVAVGTYSLAPGRTDSYMHPTPVFAYDTNSAKVASRLLAELIHGQTKRAKAMNDSRPPQTGMRYVIMTPEGDFPLRAFRERYL